MTSPRRPSGPETDCPYAAGMTVETAEDLWMRAYRKFQNFRLEHSLSVSHFFDLINDSGTSMLCCRAFTNNTLSLVQVLAPNELNAWVKEMQKTAKKIGFISPADLLDAAKSYKTVIDGKKKRTFHKGSAPKHNDPLKIGPKFDGCEKSGLIQWRDEHTQFPMWLSQRADFQRHFAESECLGDCPSLSLMTGACATVGCKRRPSQLTLILRWMLFHKILAHVSQPKLLDLCRKVKLLTVGADTKVVVQHSPGDAFYMILSGRLSVEINGAVVGALEEGMTFGERAIDNDSDRAATVTSLSECSLILIHAADYKGLTISDRAVLNVELMNFVSAHSPPFQHLSYPDLYQASRRMMLVHFQSKQQIFQEGELSKGLYVVMAGTVHLSRQVAPVDIVNSNFLLPSMRSDKVRPFHILVDQANLGPGAVFGEECLRDRSSKYNNTATATSACRLIFISACDTEVLQARTIEKIIKDTEAFHADNLTLVFAHQEQLRKKMVLRGFRNAALKPVLINRLLPKGIPPMKSSVDNSQRRRSSAKPQSSRAGARGSIGFLYELGEEDVSPAVARKASRSLSPLPGAPPPRRSVSAIVPVVVAEVRGSTPAGADDVYI